jgi:ribosomal protein L19
MHPVSCSSESCLPRASLGGETLAPPPSVRGGCKDPLAILRVSTETKTIEALPPSPPGENEEKKEENWPLTFSSTLPVCSCSGDSSGWKSLPGVSPMSVGRSRRKLPKLSVGDRVNIVFYLEPPLLRRPASQIVSYIEERWTGKERVSQCVSIEHLEDGSSTFSWRPNWPDLLFSPPCSGGNLGFEGYTTESSHATAHLLTEPEPKESESKESEEPGEPGETRHKVSLPTPRQTRRDLEPGRGKEKKTRTQAFEGTVISVRPIKGGGDCMYNVRRVYKRASAEKVFFLSSPLVKSFEVLREYIVKRSKLYYLRGRTGKAARLKPRPTRSTKPKSRSKV